MKHHQTAILIGSLLTSLNSFAQPSQPIQMLSQRLEANIVVLNMDEAKERVTALIEKHQSLILNSSLSGRYSHTNELTMLISTNQEGFNEFRKTLPDIGTVKRFDMVTTDNQKEKEKLEMELSFYRQQQAIYRDEVQKLDPAARNENYKTLFQKSRELDEHIFSLEKQLLTRKQETRFYEVNVSLQEEHGEPLESADWDFVNMPGFESTLLFVENPKNNRSAGFYGGGGLRYMFTRGKSYLTIQVLKAANSTSSGTSTIIKDMFLYGYGADFYARYFGRGKNEFFNLYSGFVVGGAFMTSGGPSLHIMHMSPHIGVEIFKNQYVVLDTRAGYFLPLTEKENQAFRGLTHNLSFNFVF